MILDANILIVIAESGQYHQERTKTEREAIDEMSDRGNDMPAS
jgi:uncharacterized protein YbjQ (UPF0145 family)